MFTIEFRYQCDVSGEMVSRIIEVQGNPETVNVEPPPDGWKVGLDGTVTSPGVSAVPGKHPHIFKEGKIVEVRVVESPISVSPAVA